MAAGIGGEKLGCAFVRATRNVFIIFPTRRWALDIVGQTAGLGNIKLRSCVRTSTPESDRYNSDRIKRMALGLRIIHEIVQALLRVWNKKDEGNLLENAARTSTASGDGSALAATGFSSPGVTTGDGAASQSPGTPSQLANVLNIQGRPLNTARLRAVERTTQLGFGGTGTHQRPENTNKGLSDPGVHIDMAEKAPRQEKQLPEFRCRRSSEVNWQGQPE